jgi:negative regulator of flagellin synthesis FlgM
MKVGQTNEPLQTDLVSRATNGSRTPAASQQQQVGAVVATDKVELSQTTLSLNGGGLVPGDATDIRPEKVEQVRRAMKEGNFHVSAEVIADKMISQAAELLQTMTGAPKNVALPGSPGN